MLPLNNAMKVVNKTEIFTLEHLSKEDKADIEKFYVKNPKGKGLEFYLKNMALDEEESGETRTYLVRDNQTHEVVAYFSLRTGLITNRTSIYSFDNLTAIELSNFAVNDNYRLYNDIMAHIGSYIFSEFIMPCVLKIQEYVGSAYLYIFALPEEKLMNHYCTMGFCRIKNKRLEKFIHRHIKPAYDKNCIFMYQQIQQKDRN